MSVALAEVPKLVVSDSEHGPPPNVRLIRYLGNVIGVVHETPRETFERDVEAQLVAYPHNIAVQESILAEAAIEEAFFDV